METRKIQKVGSGTFTVSLPKDWAEAEDIEAGSVVNLHTHLDGLLVVQSREREGPTGRVVVDVDDPDPDRLAETLRAAYAAGPDEVALESQGGFTADQRAAVRRVARNLAGVTVGEEGETRLTVQVLLDANEVSPSQSVRQLLFVALSMHRDATAALTGEASVEAIADRDDQADRLFAMVHRHFGRALARLDEVDALGLARPRLFELHATARELERVADHAERIGGVAGDVGAPTPLDEDVTAVARTARDAVEAGVGVVVGDGDAADARAALAARDRVRAEVDRLDRRLFETADADYRLTHALDSVRRTAEHAGNVAELGLRASVRRGDLSGGVESGTDVRLSTGADG